TKSLCDISRSVGAGKDVNDHVTRICKKLNEEFRQIVGKSRGMAIAIECLASSKVVRIAIRIRNLKKVRWNSTAVGFPKCVRDVMSRWPLLRSIKLCRVFQQRLHTL